MSVARVLSISVNIFVVVVSLHSIRAYYDVFVVAYLMNLFRFSSLHFSCIKNR